MNQITATSKFYNNKLKKSASCLSHPRANLKENKLSYSYFTKITTQLYRNNQPLLKPPPPLSHRTDSSPGK